MLFMDLDRLVTIIACI